MEKKVLHSTRPSNRLISEKSPYLLQHAHNPVNWYPWGDEAFDRARREDKPIFLSVGYSACHWCHVMERESFADEKVAGLLNDAFVCVKVDREERPDLDQHFMDVCQRLTGAGGWPLTIVMTPDRLPFFAGTYIPKERRWGRVGLMELVPRLREIWQMRREEVLSSADGILRSISAPEAPSRAGGEPGTELLDAACRELEADFDETHGGFGRAPKFPIPHALTFLLGYWRRTGNPGPLAMAEKTLGAMRRGGIFDHLGFGFHRYSTDAKWLVPHFEKMLYDQALLTEAYTEAFLATGKDAYRRTAEETMAYVLRDLASPEGGFYTAEDADSEGEEGRFYLWTRKEIGEALEPEEEALAVSIYGLRPEGNFAEPGGEPDGRNILHLTKPPADTARDLQMLLDKFEPTLESIRQTLFLARDKRVRPFKDTKILTDWNGLALAALARLYRITQEPRYLSAAEHAARFVLERMRTPAGRLFHMFAAGEARVTAFLDDYAFFIRGLIELYESGYNPSYLEKALGLMREAIELLWDDGSGGFFFASVSSDLPVRRREIYDGAVPSGNSVMLMNLLRLARLTGRQDLEEKARRLSLAFSSEVAAHPRVHTEFLRGLDFALGPSQEVVIVGRPDDARTIEFLEALARAYLPTTVVLFKPIVKDSPLIEKGTPPIAALAPFTKDLHEVDGRPAAYICSNGRCLRPVTIAEKLIPSLLDRNPDRS